MIDYFLSGFDGCCLNCSSKERGIIGCYRGNWCDRCLCLKGCKYYRWDSESGKGYCGIRIELLNWLKVEYLDSAEHTLRWLSQLRREGIAIPKYVLEELRSLERHEVDLELSECQLSLPDE